VEADSEWILTAHFSGYLVEEDGPELVSTDSAVVVSWRIICAGSEDLSNGTLEEGL